MNLLRALEAIRMPWLNELMLGITEFGDETVFTVVGMIILWCYHKAWGFRFMTIGLTGSALNQLLKAIFLIPRPWVVDETFTIVEAARSGATGYSFPSGHTQSAVSCFGTLAVWLKKRWVTIACVVGIALVAFSRMYLGVHTPLDVGVALATGVVTVLGMSWLLQKDDGKAAWTKVAAMALTLVLLAYVLLAPTREANVAEFDEHGVKAAWQLLGAMVGMLLAWWVDGRYLHFDTKAVWWAQLCKVVLGLALVVAVRSGMKVVLSAIFGDALFTNAIRYFLMCVVGGILWPTTFRFWGKLGKQ